MTHLVETEYGSTLAENGNRSLATALPTSANGWPPRPFQIVSLLDVIHYFEAEKIAYLIRILERNIVGITMHCDSYGNDALLWDHQPLLRALRTMLDQVAVVASKYSLTRTIDAVNDLAKVRTDKKWGYSLTIVHDRVSRVGSCLEKDLSCHTFFWIPADSAAYYDQKQPFGAEVAIKFPEANEEIIIANNCYATGNYTACVFHLMRAMEIGARYVIRKLGASKHLVNSKGANVPVELCDWHTLIQAMEKGVTNLSSGSGTSKYKKQKFEHFSHALATFRHFKNAWRNHVSHTRELYQPGKAKDILENTRQFMQHLAAR